jgi:diaminopimelate epimerase
VRLLCHRNLGVGSDGILLATSRTEPYGLRIFNPDGSEAEKSGNGLRIFAKYLVEHGVTPASAFGIRTAGGDVRAEVHREDGRVVSVTVDMGRAVFDAQSIPMLGPPREVVDEALAAGDRTVRITAVSVGNPHCVVFVDRLEESDLHDLGPRLERHPAFPRRINVQLARVTSRDRVEVLVWERGAGPTMASGSSSCAVAAAAVKRGLADRRVAVHLPGGRLDVEVGPDFALRLDGPVEEVFEGGLSADLGRRLGWPSA